MSTTDTYDDHTDTPDVIDAEPASTPTAEPTTTSTPEPDAGEPESRGREAAKYRRRLRETENELQTAKDATQTAQRALVDHLATTQGRIRPEALWASGVELADLLDEHGNVDAMKVAAAADKATSKLGLSRTPRADPTQAREVTVAPRDEWADAFRPEEQR